eukprot:1144312-Pelagomonas_calceolata.AAC.4
MLSWLRFFLSFWLSLARHSSDSGYSSVDGSSSRFMQVVKRLLDRALSSNRVHSWSQVMVPSCSSWRNTCRVVGGEKVTKANLAKGSGKSCAFKWPHMQQLAQHPQVVKRCDGALMQQLPQQCCNSAGM